MQNHLVETLIILNAQQMVACRKIIGRYNPYTFCAVQVRVTESIFCHAWFSLILCIEGIIITVNICWALVMCQAMC